MIVHRRSSSVWKPTTKRDRASSAVLVALQLKANRSAPTAPTVSGPNDHTTNFTEPTLHQRGNLTQVSQHMANQEYRIMTAFRFPSFEGDCATKINAPSPHPEDASETVSPISDTTLFEDAYLCSAVPLRYGEDIHACTASDNMLRKGIPITCATQAKEYEMTPVARRYFRHRRYISSDSAFDATERPSLSLHSRAKTNDGLLIFRANSSKEPTANVHKDRHRHKISLDIPVNPYVSQGGGTQRSEQPGVKASPAGIEVAYPAMKSGLWTAEERDLEYKHRHTFIGTGSLDDFLEILEISATHTTTKSAVARAFVHLASAEQLYARQCSTRNRGWKPVSRTSLTVMDAASADYVVQLQVRLGSITLRQYLDLIPFDEFDEAAATRVMEAFSVASHMDAAADTGTPSKARAFRSWLVQQMKAGRDH